MISETSGGETLDGEFCANVRDFYDLPMPVLIDPDEVLQDTLDIVPNDVDFVMNGDLRITYEGRRSEPNVQDALTELLSP